MNDAKPVLAVFDFDGTLIHGDSLPLFLILVAGPVRFAATFIEAVIASLWAMLWRRDEHPSLRTLIKERLILRLLAGRKLSKLQPAITRLKQRLRWNDTIRATLLEHHAKGHTIVIASGALDIYLPALLEGLPGADLICTETGQRDGRLTGEMPNGNCVRLRKAERLSAYMAVHGPFDESFGYGNLPHDLPMLELLRHRIVV